MSIRNAIRQLQKLEPGRDYAAVFERPLTRPEIDELMQMCNKAKLRVFVLNGARLVPVDKLSLVLTGPEADQLVREAEAAQAGETPA